jgi:hypothetical protein
MTRKSRGGDYPPNWRAIANEIKNEAGWRCVRCGHDHNPKAGYCLTVHHLDMNPANCEWWNLAALCQKCHLQIQNKVVMDRVWMLPHSEWFKPYVAGYYAQQHKLPTTRDFVKSRLDILILLGQQQIGLDEVTGENR